MVLILSIWFITWCGFVILRSCFWHLCYGFLSITWCGFVILRFYFWHLCYQVIVGFLVHYLMWICYIEVLFLTFVLPSHCWFSSGYRWCWYCLVGLLLAMNMVVYGIGRILLVHRLMWEVFVVIVDSATMSS
jgi:hypothetical protein